MIPANDLPLPSALYRGLQAELISRLKDPLLRTCDVRFQMEDEFKQAFQLTFTKRTRVWSLIGDLKRIFPSLMDHSRPYHDQFRQNVIIVTEPYRKLDDCAGDIRNLEFLGCEVWDLSGWEYHNPGHCTCIGIVLSKRVQKIVNLMAD